MYFSAFNLVCLSAVSKPGFRNSVPKTGNCKILGRLIFKGRPEYFEIANINMYLFIEIRHNILI